MGVNGKKRNNKKISIQKEPLWELKEMSKAFPGVQALDSVSLKIFQGEVHALIGENGSGKSTLAKCLAGVYSPESGEIYFQNRKMDFHNPREARLAGIATIYQEFSLVPTLTVAENIFMGRYPLNSNGMIDWIVVQEGTRNILDQLSLSVDIEAIVGELSVAEQQLVEIAKAISMESNLLIMDEPTAALGIMEIQRLMILIRRLIDSGKAIVYISHRLDEVREIADQVTILKDGKWVVTSPKKNLKMNDLVRLMIGFDIEQHYPKKNNSVPVNCLNVKNITTDNSVKDVSFSVNIGEVFGLGGMLGSGRTEIARAIYGMDKIISGQILLNGRRVKFNSPTKAVEAGVGMVPENRKADGCFFNFEAPKNITISRLKMLLRGFFLSLTTERKVGEQYVNKMKLTPGALDKLVQYLSGGNQQKVILARWLYSQARLLIMDEPTQGIDIGAKLEVYKVINELTSNGISIILISSDFPELLAMSDRVAVVRNGSIVKITEGQRMTEYQLISIASGIRLNKKQEIKKVASS